jgi:Asp-tRNA(Asn)/Glu-tRNA(Gln) amidotransferase A subunit family amidase
MILCFNDLFSATSQLYDGGVRGPPAPHLSGFSEIHDLRDVRVGVFPEWFNDATPLIRQRCDEVVQYLKSRGAEVVEIEVRGCCCCVCIGAEQTFTSTFSDVAFFHLHCGYLIF